jgi:drug/metabolite transporter (DMT)-like permease
MNEKPASNGHGTAGQAALVLCAVFWSTSGLFIKLVDWHPLAIAGGRSLLAAVFMLAVRWLTRKRAEPGQGRPIKSRFLLLAGGLNYAATMIIFVIANKLTSSANAILLQYTAPVWAAIFGWVFLKEKPHWEHWAALALVSAGLLMFFGSSVGGGALLGDCLALVSGITFGANAVILRKAKDQNPQDILLASNIQAALISIPFFFLYPPALGFTNVFGIIFLGFFQIGAASVLFAYGIRRVAVIQSMLTIMIEPVLNPVWVLLATGEKPSASVITGGGIIIVAVAMSSIITVKLSASRPRN